MSDVIQDAKRLLGGTTPGEWVAIPHDDWDNAKVIAPDDEPGVCEIATMFQEEHDLADAKLMAASKSHAQALAEEEYQYGVTYTGVKHGGHHIEWVENTGDAEWDKESLQLLVKHWKNAGQSPEVVRRRVSPPEVINE